MGACDSEYTALNHDFFLGTSGGSFLNYSNTITGALVALKDKTQLLFGQVKLQEKKWHMLFMIAMGFLLVLLL